MKAQIGSSEIASKYDFFFLWKSNVFPLKNRRPYEPD